MNSYLGEEGESEEVNYSWNLRNTFNEIDIIPGNLCIATLGNPVNSFEKFNKPLKMV